VDHTIRLRRVLAVLESERDQLSAVVARVTSIARDHGALVTLAKTSDPGRFALWLGPCVADASHLHDAERELADEARDVLAGVAEFMPPDVDFDTVVLPPSTGAGVSELIRSGAYDALVASELLLTRNRILRREAQRHQLQVICVIGAHRYAPTIRSR
jgi:hypothetical protein